MADHSTDLDRELADTGWIRRLARSLVRDDATADDVVQDACVAAVRAGPERPRSLRGWLAAVIRNSARRRRRDDSRRAAREAVVARPEASQAEAETVERLEAARTVVAELEALDEPYRTALRLRWIDGLAPRDVAARTGVSPEVAWKRLSRGLAMMRERLDRRAGDRAAWMLPVAGLAGLGDGELPLGPLVPSALRACPLAVASAALLLVTGWAAATGVLAPAGRPTGARPAPPVVSGDASPAAHLPAKAPSDGTPDGTRRPRARAVAPEVPSPPVAEVATTSPPLGPLSEAETPPVPQDRLVGRVIDPDGGPVPGARVWRANASGGVGGALARTDASGRFVLPQPADGSSGGEIEVDSEGWGATFARVPRLAPGEIDLGDVRVTRCAPISGVVADTDGLPLPGARLFLRRLGFEKQVGDPETTDAQGRFRFERPGEGVWTLAVHAPHEARDRWVPGYQQRSVLGGTRDVRFVFVVRQPARNSRRVEIVDESGAPVALEMRPPLGLLCLSLASFDEGRPGQAVTVTSRERFTDGGRPGSVIAVTSAGSSATAHRIVADHMEPGGWMVWSRTRGLGPAVTRFTVRPGDSEGTVRAVLSRPGGVRVRVETEDGLGVAGAAQVAIGGVPGAPWGARIWWADCGIGGWAKRSDGGTFDLEGIAAAEYSLTLFAAGWTADPVSVTVEPGCIADATLVARPGGAVAWSPEIPEGFEAEFAFAVGDGPFEVGTETVGLGPPPTLALPAFPPGRLRWRVRVAPQHRIARDGRPIATYSGDVTVVVGATVTLPPGPFEGPR